LQLELRPGVEIETIAYVGGRAGERANSELNSQHGPRIPDSILLIALGDAMKIPTRRFCIWQQALPCFGRATHRERANLSDPHVRIIVGFSAGGTTDIGARIIANGYRAVGQPFSCREPAGARHHIATGGGLLAPGDGHTLLMMTGTNASIQRSTTSSITTLSATSRRSLVIAPLFSLSPPAVPSNHCSELIALCQGQSWKDQQWPRLHQHRQ